MRERRLGKRPVAPEFIFRPSLSRPAPHCQGVRYIIIYLFPEIPRRCQLSMTQPMTPSGLQYQPLESAQERHARGVQLRGPLRTDDPAGEAERILQAWHEAGGVAKANRVFELDASAVEGVDSSGIACLVYLRRRLVESDAQLRLTGVSPRLYAILDLLGWLAAMGVETTEA